jgi:peptidoglycan/LPS O-acetylase OafA/YrhL
VPGCLVAIAAAPLARLVTRGFGLSELALVLPIGSFDSLGAGALIALVEARATPASWTRQGLLKVFAVVGVPLWLGGIALTVGGREQPLFAWTLLGFVQALAFGAVVGRAATGIGGGVGQLLESRVMVSLGRISYGMYLVHVFAPSITRTGLIAFGIEPLSLRAWAIQPLYAGVTIGLAAAMWILIEGPLNRLKRHFPYRQLRMANTDADFIATTAVGKP